MVKKYRTFGKFILAGAVGGLNKILTEMPCCGCLTIEERNVLIQLRNCINNMLLSHWDNNTKNVLNKLK